MRIAMTAALVVILSCLPGVLWAQESPPSAVCSVERVHQEMSATGCDRAAGAAGADGVGCTLELAEHFYGNQMFYRAVGAYEEVSLFSRRPCLSLRARLYSAMAYHHGEQYRRAVSVYDDVLGQFELDEELGGMVRLQRSMALADRQLHTGDTVSYELAGELEPLTRHRGSAYQPVAQYQLVRTLMLDDRRREAQDELTRLESNCEGSGNDICMDIDQLQQAMSVPVPGRKSPIVGAALSAVIPGAGSVYSQHYVDGMYYLGLVGLGGWVSAELYDRGRGFGDQPMSFYVVGTVTTLFYLSNVVQGAIGVWRYNNVAGGEYHRRIVEETAVGLPLDGRL